MSRELYHMIMSDHICFWITISVSEVCKEAGAHAHHPGEVPEGGSAEGGVCPRQHPQADELHARVQRHPALAHVTHVQPST